MLDTQVLVLNRVFQAVQVGGFNDAPVANKAMGPAKKFVHQAEMQVTKLAGLLDGDDLRRLDGEVAAELDAAVRAAEAAPFPDPSDVLTDVYVSE